jgi:hypothetical protein
MFTTHRSPSATLSGAPCVESFAALLVVNPFTLSASDRVAHLVDMERHAAWMDAARVEAVTAVAGPGPEFQDIAGTKTAPDDPEPHPDDPSASFFAVSDGIRDEVAAALRISGRSAERRIIVARDLTYKLPATRALLAAGDATYAHASAVSDECQRLSIPDAAIVEARALRRVRTQTPSLTRRSVRRAAAAVHPVAPKQKLEEEFARRDVTLHHDGGVMATITAVLPAPDAMAVFNALNACAHKKNAPPIPHRLGDHGQPDHPGQPHTAGGTGGAGPRENDVLGGSPQPDNRTIAHKRADALIEWANRAATDPDLPTMQGKQRLDIQIVIDLATLLGLAESPGELIGYGPIPAILARHLATDSTTWRRLVTDPVHGHLLDYGTTTYTPPTALREYIIARDRTCQFPGCAMPGHRCDIDHVIPYTGHTNGGTTSANNLLTLCRRHHRLKTHNNWTLEITTPPDTTVKNSLTTDADDVGDHHHRSTATTIEWTSPRGIVHRQRRPQPLDIDTPSNGPDEAIGSEHNEPERSEQDTSIDSEIEQLLRGHLVSLDFH